WELVVPAKSKDHPLGHLIQGRIGGSEYPVAQPRSEKNTLTVRDKPTGQRRPVARNLWSFAREIDGKPVEDRRSIHFESGFEPGRIYALIYAVQDPMADGLVLASFRSFVSRQAYAY